MRIILGADSGVPQSGLLGAVIFELILVSPVRLRDALFYAWDAANYAPLVDCSLYCLVPLVEVLSALELRRTPVELVVRLLALDEILVRVQPGTVQ